MSTSNSKPNTSKPNTSKPKRVQKPKSGKVIRINSKLAAFINSRRDASESWDLALSKLLNLEKSNSYMWTLPSRLIPTKSEALGIAIAEAVQSGHSLEDRETPIKVFEG